VTRAAKEFGEVHSAFRGTRVVSQVALLEDQGGFVQPANRYET
jgi:hypothetical protein